MKVPSQSYFCNNQLYGSESPVEICQAVTQITWNKILKNFVFVVGTCVVSYAFGKKMLFSHYNTFKFYLFA